MKCPVHGIPDCSPLLNGCSLVIKLHQANEDRALLKSITNWLLTPGLSDKVRVKQIRRIMGDWLTP